MLDFRYRPKADAYCAITSQFSETFVSESTIQAGLLTEVTLLAANQHLGIPIFQHKARDRTRERIRQFLAPFRFETFITVALAPIGYKEPIIKKTNNAPKTPIGFTNFHGFGVNRN